MNTHVSTVRPYLLAVLFVLAAAGCSSAPTTPTTSPTQAESVSPTQASQSATEEAAATDEMATAEAATDESATEEAATPEAATDDLRPTREVTMEMTSEGTDAAALATFDDGVITIGDISDDPTEILETHQPLADYLAANLADQGITAGEVRVAPDIETMIEWVASGEVDLYFDSPFPALSVSEGAGGEIILRRWKDGVEEYTSVFFARADADLNNVQALEGQVVSFDEPYSTSGYMLPLAYLLENGVSAVELGSVDDAVAPDQVGYFFTGDDDASVQAVISGRAAAAVVDSVTYSEIPAQTLETLAIVAETEPLPRQVAVVRPGFPPALLDAVTQVLVGMDESEDGRAVLEQFEETAQFDPFPESTEAAQARMRELYTLVTQPAVTADSTPEAGISDEDDTDAAATDEPTAEAATTDDVTPEATVAS